MEINDHHFFVNRNEGEKKKKRKKDTSATMKRLLEGFDLSAKFNLSVKFTSPLRQPKVASVNKNPLVFFLSSFEYLHDASQHQQSKQPP